MKIIKKKASDLKSYVMNNYTIDHIAPRMKTFLEKVNDQNII